MKKIALLYLSLLAAGFAAKPEDGPYSPTMSDDFYRQGELYPAALGLRPWKPADPKDYAGRFVDVNEPASTIHLQVLAGAESDEIPWRTSGTWKVTADAKHPRIVSWTNSSLELGSKHAYAEAARGCFFIFFVVYRDPDQPATSAPRPALLVGNRLFTRQ